MTYFYGRANTLVINNASIQGITENTKFAVISTKNHKVCAFAGIKNLDFFKATIEIEEGSLDGDVFENHDVYILPDQFEIFTKNAWENLKLNFINMYINGLNYVSNLDKNQAHANILKIFVIEENKNKKIEELEEESFEKFCIMNEYPSDSLNLPIQMTKGQNLALVIEPEVLEDRKSMIIVIDHSLHELHTFSPHNMTPNQLSNVAEYENEQESVHYYMLPFDTTHNVTCYAVFVYPENSQTFMELFDFPGIDSGKKALTFSPYLGNIDDHKCKCYGIKFDMCFDQKIELELEKESLIKKNYSTDLSSNNNHIDKFFKLTSKDKVEDTVEDDVQCCLIS